MKLAEQVTFGGSGLDRAAHLRENPDALAEIRRAGTGICVLLWRGKVAVSGAGMEDLLRLGADHPVVLRHGGEAGREMLFLGLDDDRAPCFAVDMSTWPAEGQDLSAVGQFVDRSEQMHPDLPEGHRFVELRRIMTHLSRRDAELAVAAKALTGWHRTHAYCACCGAGSEIAQGGWQRICPACGGAHFPRTDPVVIMLITHGDAVLVGRSPGWPEGMYSLLAGFVEPGETLEAAVRREVFEESGVRVGTVSYLASQPWPFPSSLMIGCAGEALSRDIRIDPAEIEDARWIEREDMMQIFAGEHALIRAARKGSIAHFLIRNWLADRLD